MIAEFGSPTRGDQRGHHLPHPGFTVVTGETGAGKTMIVTGLGLLLGGRADARTVRVGAERARVEGRFTISDDDLGGRVPDAGGELDDEELIVARHLTPAGRSRAYSGRRSVPAPVCAAITGQLLAIHGQSEQVRLAPRSGSGSCWTVSPGAPSAPR